MSGVRNVSWFERARCARAGLILAAVVLTGWGATAAANAMLISLDPG